MPHPVRLSLLSTGALLLGVIVSLAGCGGGNDSEATTSTAKANAAVVAADELVTTTVPGFIHSVDIYKTARATRAIVLLHGGGGNKSAIAYQVGLNDNPTTISASTILWAWLDTNKVMLVVPQGQHIDEEQNATTWRNYAMDSGQDDMAFLQALAAKIRADYGITEITLMGHSMGGVMTNRMWCESPATFDTYVSLAGPASTTFNRPATPCAPGSAAKPYMGIIGDSDEIMQTAGVWEAATWTVNPTFVLASRKAWDNAFVIGEFHQQQTRTTLVCNGTLSSQGFVHSGNVDTWSTCGGSLVLKRVLGADHSVSSLDAQMGSASNQDIMNTVMSFMTSR